MTSQSRRLSLVAPFVLPLLPLLAMVLLCDGGESAAAAVARSAQGRFGAHTYERWLAPAAARPIERRIARLVKQWARARGTRLIDDARLVQAARNAVPLVSKEKGGLFDLAAARAQAARLGWTDGELAAVSLCAPAGVDFAAALRALLESEIGRLEVNRVGSGAVVDERGTTLVVLFSRRLVRLLPTPAAMHRGASLVLRGALAVAPGPATLTLVLASPGGAITRHPIALASASADAEIGRHVLPTSARRFEQAVTAGSERGVLQVQLLIDRGAGPQIAAQLAIGVDAEPWPSGATVSADASSRAGSGSGSGSAAASASAIEGAGEAAGVSTSEGAGVSTSEAAGVGDDGDETTAALAALFLGSREASGLALPAESSSLSEIARAHAEDMRDHGYFAHTSPTSGDLRQRLRAHGVRVSAAFENLAAAMSVDDVLAQWLASPSHRANLLEPEVDAFGIGLAAQPSAAGNRLIMVLVLARLADDGASEELAARVLSRLNAERVKSGLVPLAADEELARLALAHSQEGARSGRAADTDPARSRLVDGVFRQLDYGEAAADVYVTNSLAVVTRSPHLHGSFERAGVGVWRAERSGEDRLWVTVIYAAN